MSGRRREIVTWTHNDIRNYLTNTELQEVIPEDGTIDDVDVEIKEALESEYLERLENIEGIEIQVGPYKTTFLMDYKVQRTENKKSVTYYYRASFEFAANDGGNELTQIKGYLTEANDFLILKNKNTLPTGIVDTTEPNFWLELLKSLIPILIVGLLAIFIGFDGIAVLILRILSILAVVYGIVLLIIDTTNQNKKNKKLKKKKTKKK